MKKHTTNKGFTLIELLVVISIIGIISSIVLSSLSNARVKAENVAVVANAKNLSYSLVLAYGGGNYPDLDGLQCLTETCTAGFVDYTRNTTLASGLTAQTPQSEEVNLALEKIYSIIAETAHAQSSNIEGIAQPKPVEGHPGGTFGGIFYLDYISYFDNGNGVGTSPNANLYFPLVGTDTCPDGDASIAIPKVSSSNGVVCRFAVGGGSAGVAIDGEPSGAPAAPSSS